ncbi:hypothetical protein GCM10022233_56810 [Streptomyces shaanxiensis]|uniref:Transposase IS701-like DDE domain-containing protein n=1 Tax=Streptomyces shaanxiensis TaxID=653357 RepID=A0ABP7VQD6_9ACTN
MIIGVRRLKIRWWPLLTARPGRWDDDFAGLLRRIAQRFARAEPRRRVGKFIQGLLADLPRKNCWTIAEWAGEATADGMQHLLERAKWNADEVRDDLREYVVDHLAPSRWCNSSTRRAM